MKSGQDYCYVQALGNMKDQDVDENGCLGSCCYREDYLCFILFFDFPYGQSRNSV